MEKGSGLNEVVSLSVSQGHEVQGILGGVAWFTPTATSALQTAGRRKGQWRGARGRPRCLLRKSHFF